MKSILSFLLVAIVLGSSAQAESQLRGSAATTTASEVEQERQLGNNNQWKQWMQYYNSNNNYRNYNNANGYNRYGYYAAGNRSYYKNKNQKYYKNNNQYYQQQDDAQADDAGAEEQNEYFDDDASGSDDNSATSFVPSEIEEKFWQWYESPPSQWTAGQWAWFSGILVMSVGFMFCCCLGCANLCMEGQDRACNSNNNNTKEKFDDYTSLDSGKRGSFMTLQTKESGSTTGDTVDDDATYDSIMRMRSTG